MAEETEHKINFTVEDAGPCKKKVSFEIEPDEIKKEYENNLKELISHAHIKGFRKGKAPRGMLERKYKNDLIQEVRVTVVQDAFKYAMEKQDLKPIADPEVDIEAIELKFDEALKFDLTVEVEPTFELQEYKNIEVDVEVDPVNDETIDKTLEQTKKHHGSLKEKRRTKSRKRG